MAQTRRIGSVHTTVTRRGDEVFVTYHSTDVVHFNKNTGIVTLRSGGWRTQTTRTRMNQAANELGLNFTVFQKDFEWYVRRPDGTTTPFEDGIKFHFEVWAGKNEGAA